MKFPREPESMTRDQRRREIAAILAEGVLRQCRLVRLGLLPATPESYPQSQIDLDVSRESRLHVGSGSAG